MSTSENSTGGRCPTRPRSSSLIRQNAETKRWFFIAEWCKKKGISPMNADNFNRAAMEWAKLHCF